MNNKSNAKIRLIKLREEHIEMVRKWRNSEEVSKYMYTSPHITKEQQLEWFNKIKDDPTRKYWVVEVDGEYVGLINLYNIDNQNKNAFWAYYIANPNARGKGVGRTLELNIQNYVFNKLKFHKLSCEVLAFNELVINIHKKYGSKIEGIFREHIFKEGKFHDVVRMAILKDEWEKEVLPKYGVPPCEIEE